LFLVYILYPKTFVDVSGTFVNFKTINANVIILSKNPDFSNSHYIDIDEQIGFNLQPGRYYWKSSNGYIDSLQDDFEIKSEVGMKIEENESELVNIGNVKMNVTKSREGILVGHIILEPSGSEEIENENETYTGRQNE
jgi:hypothetical protein